MNNYKNIKTTKHWKKLNAKKILKRTMEMPIHSAAIKFNLCEIELCSSRK